MSKTTSNIGSAAGNNKVLKINRGLDIKLVGEAEKVLTKAPVAKLYGIDPDEFVGITPKMLVAVGDAVQIGTPLFFSKNNAEVLFTSPVAGVVKEINRGERRKILSVVVEASEEQSAVEFGALSPDASAQEIKERLLTAGYWPMIIRRPYGIIADPTETPRDIFISAVDTNPLGVDFDFVLQNEQENLTAGIKALSKLTTGKVHVGVPFESNAGTLTKIEGASVHLVKGKHPAGNVGVQIEKIAPINKGEVVWTVNATQVAMIGRLLKEGKANFEKQVAFVGSCANRPHYYRVISGAQVSSMCGDNINAKASKTGNVRLINGNVLTGRTTAAEGYVGYYNNVVSAIAEGDYYEFAGWAMPRLNKFSVSKSYFSWLTPNKKYKGDTNLNGGERAFIVNEVYNSVMPMNILPVHLLKAIIAQDIDKMEELGIYEVVEEDVALCEFVCPSKIEWQDTLRKGLDYMIKNA